MRVLISCGEPSGDLYAGALATELRRQCPDVEIAGFGGDRLEAAGARLVAHYRGLSATGLTEALRVVPKALALLRRLDEVAAEFRPDVFVPIDFPDLNFRAMRAMRRRGIPVAYYIAPQLWAWRPARMRAMQRDVDRVLVIFPFEAPLYRDAGVPVEFVGHPLVDLLADPSPGASPADRRRALGLSPDAPTVALLPGSRRNELERLAPVLAQAMPFVRAVVPDVQFVVARAPHLADALLAPLVEARPTPVIVTEQTDAVLAAADAVVTASGTATVQCALHGRPMVVVYRLSPMTYRLGKPFARVEMYAMPNLIAGRRIVPELIQDDCTPDRVARETLTLLTNTKAADEMRAALAVVRERLGAGGGSARAAAAVLAVADAARAVRLAAR